MKRKLLGNANNRTWGRWVRSRNATSVLCSPQCADFGLSYLKFISLKCLSKNLIFWWMCPCRTRSILKLSSLFYDEAKLVVARRLFQSLWLPNRSLAYKCDQIVFDDQIVHKLWTVETFQLWNILFKIFHFLDLHFNDGSVKNAPGKNYFWG